VIINHFGNGVVSFSGILNIENDSTLEWISRVESGHRPQQYTEIDEITERNAGGYEFLKDSYDTRPTRFDKFDYPGALESDKKLKEQIDESIYLALVHYVKLFPSSMSELTFRTDGHIVKYEPGQYIGHHSDCGIPYEKDGITPISLSPLYNTVTATMALNDTYEGGELFFKMWGIKTKAKIGTITMYPSNFTGAHEVLPVSSGTRYSYLSWFGHGNNTDKSKLLVNLESDIRSINGFDFDSIPIGQIN
jgi:predicted 2-oxoglutarate/Fe(II)-dependent dioxygenase YbiX